MEDGGTSRGNAHTESVAPGYRGITDPVWSRSPEGAGSNGPVDGHPGSAPPELKRSSSFGSSVSELIMGTQQRNFFYAWRSKPRELISLKWYFTDGAEWTQVYLWLCKDLSWSRLWHYPSMVFAPSVVLWSLYLLGRAFYNKNLAEIWHEISKFLWLFANAWWFYGEWHDRYYPEAPKIYALCQFQSGIIIGSALLWISLYYVLVRPCGGVPVPAPSKPANEVYDLEDDIHVPPRQWCPPIFQTWREYENLHILLWMGKDCCWVWEAKWPFLLFMVCTLALGIDFALLTSHERNGLITHVHYIAQLLWVVANISWAFGELWGLDLKHDPYPLFEFTDRTVGSGRWFAAYILIATLGLIAVLYVVWVPFTVRERCLDPPSGSDEDSVAYGPLSAGSDLE